MNAHPLRTAVLLDSNLACPCAARRPQALSLLCAMGAALVLGLATGTPAQARDRVDVNIGLQFDSRYHHDRYYPAPGYVVPRAPSGAVLVGWQHTNYYFHGGVWYRPYGPRLRVILPPVGIIVPVLPPAYVTLTVGGAPYYYANGVYYAPAPSGYAVVQEPPGVMAAPPAPLPPPTRPEPIIYPRQGQSGAQTEADRQECNRWASTQRAAMNDASVFNRAVEACMDGRGYSMR